MDGAARRSSSWTPTNGLPASAVGSTRRVIVSTTVGPVRTATKQGACRSKIQEGSEMAVLATVLALLVPQSSADRPEFAPASGVQHSGTLQYRTAQRERAVGSARMRPPKSVRAGLRHRARAGHCKTQRCEHSMRRRHRAEVERNWRKVARPYRGWLASTRACESSPWLYDLSTTGNGFWFAYQHTPSSWGRAGGHFRRGRPAGVWTMQPTPAEQDFRAVVTLKQQGRGAWPVCG